MDPKWVQINTHNSYINMRLAPILSTNLFFKLRNTFYTFSQMVATPMPPPMQRVDSPSFALVFSIS